MASVVVVHILWRSLDVFCPSTCGITGSPAVFEGKQIGLNSWGPGDCDPRYPTVLTSVPFYYEWIAEQCPECVAVDGIDDAEGQCMGMESKWDRGCSRKTTQESCVGVRRGTVCRWTTNHIPETAAFVIGKERKRLISFDDTLSGGAVQNTFPIPWPCTLFIASCLVVIAVSVKYAVYQWDANRDRNSRMGSGYHSLLDHETTMKTPKGRNMTILPEDRCCSDTML